MRRGAKIRKVVIGTSNTPIAQIAEQLRKFHDQKGRRLIALKLQLNGPEDRSDTWLNPMITQSLAKMQQALNETSKADGNASAKGFWEKMLRLHELDAGLCFDGLRNEIENFRRAFEFS